MWYPMSKKINGTPINLLNNFSVHLSHPVKVKISVNTGNMLVMNGKGGGIMSRNHYTHFLLQLNYDIEKRHLRCNVNGCRRFIEKQNKRIGNEGAGNEHPL